MACTDSCVGGMQPWKTYRHSQCAPSPATHIDANEHAHVIALLLLLFLVFSNVWGVCWNWRVAGWSSDDCAAATGNSGDIDVDAAVDCSTDAANNVCMLLLLLNRLQQKLLLVLLA